LVNGAAEPFRLPLFLSTFRAEEKLWKYAGERLNWEMKSLYFDESTKIICF
jgi:hypothetical protein